jgi:hypothetical protein
MAETVSDFIVSRLREWSVARIYGYPGDGINGLMAALRKAGDQPRFIQARHEEMAASSNKPSRDWPTASSPTDGNPHEKSQPSRSPRFLQTVDEVENTFKPAS